MAVFAIQDRLDVAGMLELGDLRDEAGIEFYVSYFVCNPPPVMSFVQALKKLIEKPVLLLAD